MIDYLKREEYVEPQSDKIIIGGKIERLIFENINFHPDEQQKLKELKLALSQLQPILLPREWQDSDYMRILAYCDYQIDETIKILNQHLQWKKAINLNSQPSAILTDGSIYINGYDRRFRPVLIINLQSALQYSLDQFQQTFDFIVSLLIRDVLVSHFIESIVLLVEANVFISQQKKCEEKFFEFIEGAEQHFYGRFHKIYILEEKEQSQNFQILNILKPQTQEKIIFLPKTQYHKLTNQIDPNNLEMKFQGNQENITSHFWPPQNPKKQEYKSYLSVGQFEESQKSPQLRSRPGQEGSYSQLILQVCNEEQEVILSESHLIEDSIFKSNLEHHGSESNYYLSQKQVPFTDVTPPQSTTVKRKDQKIQQQMSWESSSEIQFNSDVSNYSTRRKPCCQTQTCQLI